MDHLDSRRPLTGPCLKHCGSFAIYLEVDHDTEEHLAICEHCGRYRALREDMDHDNIEY